MTFLNYATIIIIILMATTFASASTWTNQLGSKVTFDFQSDGTLTGNYSTAVTGQPGIVVSQPLSGRWSKGDLGFLVGFTVVWTDGNGNPTSVTSWTGQGDGQTISTTWILTRIHEAKDAWESTVTNQDTFTLSN